MSRIDLSELRRLERETTDLITENAALIAAVRNALPELLNRLEAAEKVLQETLEGLNEMVHCQSPEGAEYLLAFVKAKARAHIEVIIAYDEVVGK